MAQENNAKIKAYIEMTSNCEHLDYAVRPKSLIEKNLEIESNRINSILLILNREHLDTSVVNTCPTVLGHRWRSQSWGGKNLLGVTLAAS